MELSCKMRRVSSRLLLVMLLGALQLWASVHAAAAAPGASRLLLQGESRPCGCSRSPGCSQPLHAEVMLCLCAAAAQEPSLTAPPAAGAVHAAAVVQHAAAGPGMLDFAHPCNAMQCNADGALFQPNSASRNSADLSPLLVPQLCYRPMHSAAATRAAAASLAHAWTLPGLDTPV
jgi:hypothetical protein